MSVAQETVPATTPELNANAPAPMDLIFGACFGYVISACLNVVAKLGIADLIGAGAKDVDALAQQSGAHAGHLARVLRTLESAGIFRRTENGEYALTPAGQLLRSDVEGSAAETVEWTTDPLHFQVYGELLDTVKSGAITFDRVYQRPFFQWISQPENGEEFAVFNNAMTSISQMCLPAFLEAYDFSQFKKIVDVGGGHGASLRAILKQNPQASGIVADMPSVVSETRVAIAADGLDDRCEAVECDFFASVPAGGDCYFMKHIVHDWSDAQALQLLRNVRAAVPADGRLVLAEAVLDDGAAPHPGKVLDIEMMSFVGGKERSEAEFRELLLQAGFRLVRVVPTKSILSLLEAVPV